MLYNIDLIINWVTISFLKEKKREEFLRDTQPQLSPGVVNRRHAFRRNVSQDHCALIGLII
jgi:hypothetical protein